LVGDLIDPDLEPVDFFVNPREGYDDIRNLFAGVEFLRYLEGEKHILFLTERGLTLPGRFQRELGAGFIGVETQKQYDDFAALAADARVTISPVGTGGLDTYWTRARVFMVGNPHRTDNYALAKQTGGMASFYRFADRAVDRLDRATRFQYLIGYYPENPEWDGAFREIEVLVGRPSVTVLNRKGYFARDELVPYDRREFMSYARIMAAASNYRLIRDIRVAFSEPRVTGPAEKRILDIDVEIDPRDVSFAEVNGERVAALHVAVFVGDREENLLGERWDVVDLRVDPETFARLQKENFAHTVQVSFTGEARHLKAVVYDYRGDRIGVIEREIR